MKQHLFGMFSHLAGLVLICTFASRMYAACPPPESSASPLDPRVKETLQSMKKELEETKSQGAGLAFVVRRDSQGTDLCWAGGVGLADLTTKQAMTQHSIFPIASVSKLFIGMALANLHASGIIDLDKPLASYAPALPIHNSWAATHPITVRHLLEHTTGLQEVILKWYDDSLPSYMSATEAVQNHIPAVSTLWPPGTVATYSNYNYIAASYVIEQVTGESFDAYIERTLFAPLDLKHTSFRKAALPQAYIAKGYAYPPLREIPHAESFYRYAAGLWSSPHDLAKVLSAILHDGALPGNEASRITTPSALELMESPKTSLAARAGSPLGHGAGATLRQTKGRILVGHGGAIDGFSAGLYYSRELGFAYAFLFNAHLLGQVPSRSRLEDAFFEHLVPERLSKQTPLIDLSPISLDKWVGFYRYQNPRFALTGWAEKLIGNVYITRNGSGGLRVKNLFRQEDIWPVSEHLFRGKDELVPRYAFGRAQDGERYLYETANRYYKEASPILPQVTLLAIVTALLLAALYPLSLPFGVFSWWRLWPLLPSSCLLCLVGFFATIDTSPMATSLNITTRAIYAASSLFPVLALASVALTACKLKQGGLATRAAFLTSTGLAFVAVYLASQGFWMLRLWDYHRP